jgi:hypothetical protein
MEATRVFQSFITKTMYKVQSDVINEVLTNASIEIWRVFRKKLYYCMEGLNCGWDNWLRMFLKGGKANLKSINKQLEKLSEHFSQQKNILRMLLTEIILNENDSDYDFSVVMNPNLFDYEDENINKVFISLSDIIEVARHFISNNLPRSYIDNLTANLNDLDLQKRELYPSLIKAAETLKMKYESIINESIKESEKQEKIKELENLGLGFETIVKFELLANLIKTGTALDFNFISVESKYPKSSQSTINILDDNNQVIDQFLLFRVFLKFNIKQASDLLINKQFGECIDLSFSTLKSTNEAIWKKSNIDNMLMPVDGLISEPNSLVPKELQEILVWKFPIANLNYQIKDQIVMISEFEPSKPDKRCKRFIEQIKMFCVMENLPSLPAEIIIGSKVWELMQNEKSECFKLREIIDFDKIKINDESKTVTVAIKDEFKSLDKFERWCNVTKISPYQNLSWDSGCPLNFMSKQQLVLALIELLQSNDFIESNLIPTTKHFLEFNKSFICKLYKDLVLITTLVPYYLEYIQDENRIRRFSPNEYIFTPEIIYNISSKFKNIEIKTTPFGEADNVYSPTSEYITMCYNSVRSAVASYINLRTDTILYSGISEYTSLLDYILNKTMVDRNLKQLLRLAEVKEYGL